MAHDEQAGLAYADYFAAAAAAGAVATLVPEEEEDLHLYGVHHQHGVELFGPSRGHMLPAATMMAGGHAAAAAHGKAAALGLVDVDVASPVVGGHDFGDHHHRQQGLQAPLSLALHHHHHQQQLGGGGVPRHNQLSAAWPGPQQQQGQGAAWHLRGSRFLRPTQQLLQEFCTLPVDTTTTAAASKQPASEDGVGVGSSTSAPSAQIHAMSASELQRLKAKLYAMLQEVERRYRRYREQMRAVAGSFEAVAGEQAAVAYTRLASRTISKHFRSLRDGVAAQMQVVRRALGEKDADGGVPAAGGMVKGETTPRLRVIDQCLRQHRAYQAGVLESQPWRPQRGLPERAVSILRAWLFEHFLHPYPSDVDKHILARQTGLSRSQVSNWFINARVRLWKPMVEEMYSEEMKDPQEGGGGAACSNANNNSVNTSSYTSELGQQQLGHGGGASGVDGRGGERKPTRAQLLVHDAGSLASVVSIGSSSRDQQQQMSSINFGMMDHLDFDAYNDDPTAAGPGGPAGGFGAGGSGGVSLTLGLQHQHADDPHGGVNIAFAGAAPSAAHEFLFMAGGGEQQMVAGGAVHPSHGHGHGHHGQFSAAGMQGDGVPSSHYHRGLSAATGFQLLHDLAG
ncbi:hypothetical protein SORBI_3001G314900 [Sorghum bicolor]|uniref:Homeobox domain-containing protein n=1 Tax=Sorghum bicolor TaxID=4558 RepID=A0A1Z5S8I1_SORBI|nr:hypothetical protein SORBI_3001G314900 [Sorghum bicolor]OQU92237.1 hypothetical protein SORBI_3001G314900 [Sorghum bicolor]OQU92240.1 hypothetical protein SORBI_3001G314900 [Sorghum bicolor]